MGTAFSMIRLRVAPSIVHRKGILSTKTIRNVVRYLNHWMGPKYVWIVL